LSKLKVKLSSTRREFAKSLAIIAAAPIVSAPVMSAPVVSRAAEPAPMPASARLPQQTPPADQPSPVADALTEVVRLRHGKHLNEDQLNLVKRSIDRSQRNAERMKQFKLTNGDEPSFAFTADLQS
jgi:hypothetical protein